MYVESEAERAEEAARRGDVRLPGGKRGRPRLEEVEWEIPEHQ